MEHRLLLHGGSPTVDDPAAVFEGLSAPDAYSSPVELSSPGVPGNNITAAASSSPQQQPGSATAELIDSGAIVAQSEADLCDAGDRIVLTDITISSACTVTGSLTVHGGGRLTADFTADPDAVLRIEGDVSVGGSGILWVEGGTFEIQQDFNRHRKMWTTDDATVVLRGTEVVLGQGGGSKYLVYNAFGNSKLFVADSHLDKSSSWLLANQFNRSRLLVHNSDSLPTEIFVKEGSTVQIAGETQTGVWLDFAGDARGTIALPAQTDASGHLKPYSWSVGRDTPSLLGVPWQLEISESRVGIGIESRGDSEITVMGQGLPATGELTIAYHVDGGTSELRNLGTGLQNRSLGDGRLTLHNVQLGPIAWQVYAHDNDMLSIYSSILNEVGVSANGHITVYDSYFQLAGIAAIGDGTASIDIHNSQIFSQSIHAFGSSVININNSAVYGATVVSHDPTSEVNFHGGAFLTNAIEACPFDLDVMLDERGVPNCNPFLEPGAVVTKAGPGIATCDGTYNCDWQAELQLQPLLQQPSVSSLLGDAPQAPGADNSTKTASVSFETQIRGQEDLAKKRRVLLAIMDEIGFFETPRTDVEWLDDPFWDLLFVG